MPSNDINGDPILILSLEEAKMVHEAIVNPMGCNNIPLYGKVSKFLREVEDDNHKSTGEGVYQKRLWPE
jgi:hypothetical protein